VLQLALQIDLPAARPLIPLEACMVLCDEDEDTLLHNIEDGTIAWAFNVGDPGSARREIRVWRDALLKVLRRQDTTLPGTAAEVLAQILPRRDPRTTELQRLFSCSSTHIHDLIAARCLTVTRPARCGSGPNAAPLLALGSVREFLLRGLVR
jgi:hypothetical protein